MASPAVAIIVSTIFFAGIALIGFFVGPPKNHPEKGVIQTMVITTCVCMWLFYLFTYMAQINPLVGPQLKPDMGWLKE
eukprot:m.80924 g.80924  ORF g.80924 m.80924 type:complete len:78 (+) comp20951_c0_seq2:659-892(+)